MGIQRERKDIEKSLMKKGFSKRNGPKHDFYTLEVEQVTEPIFTKISRGTDYKTIHEKLLITMSHQTKLSKEEFLRYVDCSIEKDEYISILRNKKLIKEKL